MRLKVDRVRQEIQRDAEHDDEEIRRLAVERALQLPSHEAIQLLIRCLGDPSWRVRKAAIERLVSAPSGWLVTEAVVEALADESNAGRRNAALEALTRCGERVIPTLLEVSHREDADVRKLVVDVLAGIGDERTAPRLLEMLEDPDANVRAAAAEALGVVGGSETPQALLRQVTREEEDRLVRLAALRSLAHLEVALPGDALGSALDDPILQPAALSVLGRLEDGEAEQQLLKALRSKSRSTREAAVEGLLRVASRLCAEETDLLVDRIREASSGFPLLIEDMLERLGEADLGLRLQFIQFLGLLRPPETAMRLIDVAGDEALREVVLTNLEQFGSQAEQELVRSWSSLSAEARSLACELFGRTDGLLGKQQLIAMLDDADPQLRAEAARSLGRRCAGEAVEPILRRFAVCARDADPDTEEERAALAEALVSIASPRSGCDAELTQMAVASLVGLLDQATSPLRLAIARVLGEIGRSEDAALLKLLLQDPLADVRRVAVTALARIQEGAVSEPLRLALADDAPTVRMAAAAALGAARDASVLGDLERLLEDKDHRVRAAAARAVGECLRDRRLAEPQKEHAFALLERALADDGLVAMATVEALTDTGSEGAVAARILLNHAHPELVQAAIRCIARQGDAEAAKELVPLVAHPAWSVRAEAIQVLAERGIAQAVPAIHRRLEIEQDEFVRHAILQALAKLEG